MAHAKPKAERPLSPHLLIYRPWLSMIMSIFHRITGAAAYFAMALLAWWLAAAASGPEALAFLHALAVTPLGQILLIGVTWVYIHHAVGGVRHMIWDSGRGFSKPSIDLLARLSPVASVALTAAIWFFIYRRLGAF